MTIVRAGLVYSAPMIVLADRERHDLGVWTQQGK